MEKKPPDKSFMIAIKNTMNNMYHKSVNPESKNVINDAVLRVSKIVFHTYNFLNLYFMHLYNNNQKFPVIEEHFILIIMMLVSERIDNRGAKIKDDTRIIMDGFINFYNEHYVNLITEDDIVYDDKLKQILIYEARDIEKNIKNNISEHYIQHVRKFVNISFNLKFCISDIRSNSKLTEKDKKLKISLLTSELNKVKNDILNPIDVTELEFTSHQKYHKWILENKPFITPCKESYEKNSMFYDVKVNPQDYLFSMFTINKKINQLNQIIFERNEMRDIYNDVVKDHNKKIKELNKKTQDNKFLPNSKKKIIHKLLEVKLESQHRLFHVLPLRTSIIPKNITIDSHALVNLIMKSNKIFYFKNITLKRNEIWSTIFNLKDRIFKKKGYSFHYMIKTDGVSCSVLFIKLDNNNKPIKPSKKQIKELATKDDSEYIENVVITKQMKNKLLVAIDPNHGNLISCLSENRQHNEIPYQNDVKGITFENSNGKKNRYKNKNYSYFRYTRSQRNVETRNNKYKKIREYIKKTEKIENETVEMIESKLSIHNSKTCDVDDFTSYLKEKIKVNRVLSDHYSKIIYRKLKMNLYINTQKSESKLIENFKKTFGPPENVIIVFGDYDMQDTMKGCEPHISKRLRKLLKRYGYEVYKINEYNTSKLCNKCGYENELFMHRYQSYGKDEDLKINQYLLWSLLRCKNEKCKT